MSYCAQCLEDFRYDDTGGYNPPARCQEHCRNCCDGHCMDDDREWEDDGESDLWRDGPQNRFGERAQISTEKR